MERMRRARHAILAGIAAAAPLVALRTAAAQVSLYWDGDGVGPVGGGTGTWNTTLTRWSLTPDGTVFQAWVNTSNDDAVFANAPGTVSIPVGVTARSLDFQLGGYTLSGTGPLTLAGSTVGTINVASGGATVGAPVAGIDGFTKTGPGNLVLTANSTATGNRRVIGGAISIDSSLRIPNNGTVTLDGGTIIQTNPSTVASSFIQAGTALDIGASGGTVSFTGAAGSVSLYQGTIRGPGATLTKVGTGEFRYQGTGLPNTTYSKLVVREGLFRLGFVSPTQDERGFGAAPGSLTADAITLDGGAIGTSFGATLHTNRGITLGAGGGTINVTAGAMSIPSQISDGTGAGSLAVVGTSASQLLTLSNPSNQIAGGIIIRGGRLNVTATGASGTGDIQFDLGANTGGLSNNAAALVEVNNPLVSLGGAAGTPEIGAASGFTLQINSQVRGARPIQKTSTTGNGTLVLTNSANDFTGGVVISTGRLVITSNNALGSAAGATTINSGAVLGMRGGFDYTTAEPLTVGGTGISNSGAIVNFQDNNRFAGAITLTANTGVGVPAGQLELAGPLSGSFRLEKEGPGTLVLAHAGNSFGSMAINAGTVVVSADGNLGAAPLAFGANNVQIAGTALRATSSFSVHPNRGINLVGNGSIDVSTGITLTYPGAMGGGSLNKMGPGTLVLSGVNGHTGGTTIHAGTLSLTSTGVLPGDVTIAPGAALHGSGSVGGNVTVGGTISPGASPGALTTTGNHTWQGGGAYAWEIDNATGTPVTNWDHVTMNAVTISATAKNKFTIRIVALPGGGGPALDNFDPDAPAAWVIATATSGTVNNFDLEAFEIDASQFEQNNENKGGFYVSRSGGDLMLNYVPEPGTAGVLMLAATSALLGRHRRR